ncbi:peptidase M23-like protein [Dyadobacter jejuensis]|uniref:Peptidase M23-like protein n=1 Tax=Dyadobacter jejuensis TaxID=1082580 RepID=A0A316ABU4_9BACT|nr:M23 family metallopeptidase [Dyadobacter jejuensis]PWJ54500.1 peptidase M23-like protein [Dyadobacter jejuensis]
MLNNFGTRVPFILFLLFLLGLAKSSIAQRLSYPKGYYSFPIRPGLANSLSGGLGDLRSNHFHAGTDIRTQQREGLPVHAAADGYVYKVGVQRGGYGNVLYLRHPNGQTTVYGHLKVFEESVAQYVREQQYAQQKFEIDLYPQPGAYSFKKGEVIALSGNTGGSAGPHLHFEIRDSKDNYLNPLFFGFKEVVDRAAPKFVSLALRPLTIDSRVNDTFERQEFKVERLKDGSYRLPTVKATGVIGMDLQAFDLMTGTGFRYGLQCVEVHLDDEEIFVYNMEIFPNEATREYNNQIDYETRQQSGDRLLKCYIPDGHYLDLYKTNQYKGRIMISDTLEHKVRVVISDAYHNSSELVFRIQGEQIDQGDFSSSKESEPSVLSSYVQENTLRVDAANYQSGSPMLKLYQDGSVIDVLPASSKGNNLSFLVDLRNNLPDSVGVGNKILPTHFKKALYPGLLQRYDAADWSIATDSSSLFDTLYVKGGKQGGRLSINDNGVALRSYVKITYRPDVLPDKLEKSHVYRYSAGKYSYVGGEWKDGVIVFTTRELGDFVVRVDSIPPKLRVIEQSKGRIAAYISDGDSGIDDFRAEVNGEWVLLNYEYKTGLIWSDKLDKNKSFDGELYIKITDRAGNNTILRTEIK